MTEALESRSQALTETMSNRVMDIARTLADGGKEVVGALDKRIDDITNTINTRGQRLAETIDTKVADIDRTLGNRATEVASTLDDRIVKFEELLVGRAEKLAEQVETRTRAAAGVLDASNDAIRTSTDNLERMLMTVSSAVGEGAQAERLRRRAHAARRKRRSDALLRRQGRRNHHHRQGARGGNDPHPRFELAPPSSPR